MRPQSLFQTSVTLGVIFVIGFVPLQAQTHFWGSDTTAGEAAEFTSWQDATHWFTDAAGTTPVAAFPGSSDHAVYSISSLNGTNMVPRIWANTEVNALTFNNVPSMTVTGGGGNRLLTIGSGGVTINGGSVILGTSTANRNVFPRFIEDQTWTNNGSGTLSIRNSAAASDAAAGDVVLTFNAAGSGGISNSGAYSDGAAGSLGMVIDSAGTGVVTFQSSTYSGGTLIKRGILSSGTSATQLGTQEILLGDSSGSASATMRNNSASTIVNDLTVQANDGLKTLELARDVSTGSEWGGNILLNDDLDVGVRPTTSGSRISGMISGTGDLYKTQYQGGNSGILTLNGLNSHSGDTIVENGTLRLGETGGLTFYIGPHDVNNRLLGTGTVVLDGAFSFDLSAAGTTPGDSWMIVDVGNLAETFGATFMVADFTPDVGGDVWTKTASTGVFSFTESSGLLTFAIPEPSTVLLFVGGLLAIATGSRRRNDP